MPPLSVSDSEVKMRLRPMRMRVLMMYLFSLSPKEFLMVLTLKCSNFSILVL